MRIYRTAKGNLLEKEKSYFSLPDNWDALINRGSLHEYLGEIIAAKDPLPEADALNWIDNHLLPPIGSQEVWAAGVTYLRSRDARMEESVDAGGATLYDKVYSAARPELFFKSLPHRVSGHGDKVYIRKDSDWNVPEPELALFINTDGDIQAYTIGNDMSSRSIEGENPLYLPQAKIYEKSAALGPCLFVPGKPIEKDTTIEMVIKRNNIEVYRDSTPISKMKRSLPELVSYLYRECDFIYGSFLMTGTCLVPPDDFTLREDDIVDISIDGIGVMTNIISTKP